MLWSLEQAHVYAAEVEAALRGTEYRKFLSQIYGDNPRLWKDSLRGQERLRTITNYLTRMRYVYKNGALDLQSKGPAPNPGSKVVPWFALLDKQARKNRLIFGHWAALNGAIKGKNLFAVDTGCVWGGKLSMFCLDTGDWHRCDC